VSYWSSLSLSLSPSHSLYPSIPASCNTNLFLSHSTQIKLPILNKSELSTKRAILTRNKDLNSLCRLYTDINSYISDTPATAHAVLYDAICQSLTAGSATAFIYHLKLHMAYFSEI
jgi:hypothetical protein